MDKNIQAFYEKMPPSIQSILASAYGYTLLRWRYGSTTETLVNQAFERETYSPEQWKKYQEEHLAYILSRAVSKIPYYRDLWSKRRQKGDKTSWEYLENWPVLDKDIVRQYPKAFLAEDKKPSEMYHSFTTGTTGKPLELWSPGDAEKFWYALVEARWRRWHGVDRTDRWALIGGQPIVPSRRRRPPFWVWNSALNQLYLSANHMNVGNLSDYIGAFKKYDIQYLISYPSVLFILANQICQQARCKLPIKVIITQSEPLYAYQRAAIEKAFECPVRETYGMSEKVMGASQCDSGKMHLWPEAGIIEVLDCNLGKITEGAGDFVCTSLINPDMCLIRYQLGDRGSIRQLDEKCSCGRTLPILESLDGSNDDILYSSDRRYIWWLSDKVLNDIPIMEAQIIQDSFDHVNVRLVPAAGYSDEIPPIIISRIQNIMGPIEVDIEKLNSIPRGLNGKFKTNVCTIPAKDRPLFNKNNQDKLV
jgi:phenylacetate-CoA ligase